MFRFSHTLACKVEQQCGGAAKGSCVCVRTQASASTHKSAGEANTLFGGPFTHMCFRVNASESALLRGRIPWSPPPPGTCTPSGHAMLATNSSVYWIVIEFCNMLCGAASACFAHKRCRVLLEVHIQFSPVWRPLQCMQALVWMWGFARFLY